MEEKRKKVGILTLPLHNNYGGILQAYALMASLKQAGHEAILINYNPKKPLSSWKIPFAILKRFMDKFILGKDVIVFKERKIKEENKKIQGFIDRQIQPQTVPLYGSDSLHRLDAYQLNACVVGSDQVWREKYNKWYIENYFFDFVKDKAITKFSYAASFGVDTWDFDEATTTSLRKLANDFKAVSVREDSGVKLCSDALQVPAQHHLDPTMLLTSADYLKVIQKGKGAKKRAGILTYILDSSDEKEKIVLETAARLQLNHFSIGHGHQKDSAPTFHPHPSIESWIEGFADADFVVTDSFHGCVFSIIFNKPFVVIGNDERGMARFNSLLKTFNLESRLVKNLSDYTQNLTNSPIDWQKVNLILENKRSESFTYFKNTLG